MIEVDCVELSPNEQSALAGAITEVLNGSGIAILKGRKIVLDDLSEAPLDEKAVDTAISNFVKRRKGSRYYSIERLGDTILIHSADPVAVKHDRRIERLPPNVLKCPFCSFITPYEEEYVVHYRSHGFV